MLRLLVRGAVLVSFLLATVVACEDDPVRDDGSVDLSKDAGRDAAKQPSVEPENCGGGGCSLPPFCNADGTSPSTKCSCGCPVGKSERGGVCTAAGCVAPLPDGGAGEGGDGGDGG